MDWSDYLAIGGAVGGVAGFANLGWRIFEWRLRQARIKVRVAEGLLGNQPFEVFIVQIRNYGKEPVKINSVGFKCTERRNLFLFTGEGIWWDERLPYELKGNDSCSVYVRKDVLSSGPVEIPLIAWCGDTFGRVYYSKKYKINFK